MCRKLAATVLFAALATPLAAQELDPRWQPWVGCWEMVNGSADVCITPAPSGGVTLTTRVNSEPELKQVIVADGMPRPLSEAGCSGTQRAEWSRNGRRLFARAELACAPQPSRSVSGLTLITDAGVWLDVQAVETAGRTSVRVRRYRRASDAAARDARTTGPDASGAAFTAADVKEASAKVSVAAVEAALAETRARVPLSGRDLVDLDDAGVPDSVIDLLVAQAYPEKFQVERREEASLDLYPPAFLSAEWSSPYWGLGYPYFTWYPGYFGYRYFSSPFAFGYFGYYDTYSYYYPRSVGILDPGGVPSPAAPEQGRLVNGVGYTRVRPREAVKADTGSAGGGSSRGSTLGPSGYTQSNGGSSSSGSSSGASSSGGSGGSDGGRIAVPR
jgi:hypothetical protein